MKMKHGQNPRGLKGEKLTSLADVTFPVRCPHLVYAVPASPCQFRSRRAPYPECRKLLCNTHTLVNKKRDRWQLLAALPVQKLNESNISEMQSAAAFIPPPPPPNDKNPLLHQPPLNWILWVGIETDTFGGGVGQMATELSQQSQYLRLVPRVSCPCYPPIRRNCTGLFLF